MSATHTITLGARVIEVSALPLGKLRKLLPVFNRVGRAFSVGQVDESVLDEVLQLLCIVTGLAVDDLESIPCTYPQLLDAVATIADVCGLKPKEAAPQGKAGPGVTPSPV